MAIATESLKPGEHVLAYRIRSCFPARLRDMMLPADDLSLVTQVTNELHTTNLTNRQACDWVRSCLERVRNNADIETNEANLMAYRINTAFAELVANG